MSTTSNMAPRLRRIGLTGAVIGLAALAAAALPVLTSAGEAVVAAATSPATVEIDNFTFAPATLTVTAGTTVTWKNEDDSPHRIGDQNGTFKSAALDTDDTFSHTFAWRRANTRISARCTRTWSGRSSSDQPPRGRRTEPASLSGVG